MSGEIAIVGKTEMAVRPELKEGLLIRFIDYLDVSPKTVETYGRALKQFFSFLHLNGISRPERQDVLSFKASLSDKKPTTVQAYITAVRIFFKWASQENLYPNIAEHVKGAKIDRAHKKDHLTANQVKDVLKTVDTSTLRGKRDYAILALMITGGLRDIEVSRANVQDIRTAGNGTVLYLQGKGRIERTEFVKIPDRVETVIRDYLKARGNTEEGAPLFSSLSNNHAGGRLTTRAISGMVKARLQDAGLDSERLTAHSLRHTAVTLALNNGMDITEVQQFARHAHITTTMIYNHALERAKNGCSAAISGAIFC